MSLYDAALVDGDNVARVEVMMLKDALVNTPVRKFFGGAAIAGWGWFGNMDFVCVPKIGKESVDRAIAMEAVRLYLLNDVRKLLLVSHDMDYGDTAIHLKNMFPDMQITIAANPRRISEEYRIALDTNDIRYTPLFDLQKPLLTAKLYSLYETLAAKNPCEMVTLEAMGDALRLRHDYMTRPLKSRQLSADMRALGFIVTETPEKVSSTLPILKAPPPDEWLGEDMGIS